MLIQQRFERHGMATDLDLSGQTGSATLSFSQGADSTKTRVNYSVSGAPTQFVSEVGNVAGTDYGDTITFNIGIGNSFHLASFAGGSGYDILTISGRGSPVDLAGMTGIERFNIGGGTASIPDSIFINIPANGAGEQSIYMQIYAGSIANPPRIDASSITAHHNFTFNMSYDFFSITSGAGDDLFIGNRFWSSASSMIHGGLGYDIVYVTDNISSYNGSLGFPAPINNFDGMETYWFDDLKAYYFKLADNNFVGITGNIIVGELGAKGGALDGSLLSASNAVWLYGSAAADALAGGAGNDAFWFTSGTLGANDTVVGGAGSDQLMLLGAGTFDVSQVSGIEYYQASGTTSITLADSNFTGVAGTLAVNALTGGTVNASAVGASHSVMLIGSGTEDHLIGGSGSDVFSFTGAFASGSTVVGGAGADGLLLLGGASGSLAGISGVENYVLGSAGSNSVSLNDSNVAGLASFGIQAGASGDSIDASAITDLNAKLYLLGSAGDDTMTGGAGADVLVSGGGHDILAGGAGADAFGLSADAIATIQDFLSGTDALVFSDAQFDLGANEGTGATVGFDRLDPSAFSTTNDGTFTNAGQRFAYNAASHELLYAAHGSASLPAETHVVAELIGVASLDSHGFFFIG
jgi:Ca2+-binding RTX toxin-like protein